MKKNEKQVPTRFVVETRFEVPSVPFRGTHETELERLKQRLLRRLLDESASAEINVTLRRAANDAASLAWLTPYPLLVFPALLEEKAERARAQARRQARIRRSSHNLLAEAV
jgi:hypothetical protein